MANNIKGITIELDGDTTGLTDALKDVDKASKRTSGELREVERMLKFDPTNVDLLAQRQELLAEQIQNTTTRLNTMRQAQQQVQQQFERGEIDAEQYRAFQRELIRTEGQLESLQQQARRGIEVDAEADTSGIDKMKTALKELGPAAKNAAKEIGSALGNAGAAAAAGIGALVVGSTDLNNDLARLRTNATLAGNDLGLVEDAFKQITAVTGETDSAVETVSNLLASGFKDNQLQAVVEGINGAAIKFSDTLKTEGIADGIQETFATGEAIGMFAELLERSGVDLESFNEKLAVAKKNGTEADLVLQTMADLGLTSVSDKYKELNPELVANNEATVQMQTALADLAIILTPLVTMIAQLVTQFVQWATANPQLVITLGAIAGVVAGIAGAFALLSPIISAVVSLWGVLSGAVMALLAPITTTATAVGGLGGVLTLLTGPIGIAIAAIVAIVGALVVAYNKVEWFRDGVNQIWNAIKDYTSQAFNAVKDLVVDLIGSAVEFGKGLLEQFSAFWEQNGQAIITIVRTCFEQVREDIENVMNVIKGIFEVIWPIISGVVMVAWETMQLTIGNAITAILGIIQVAMELLQGDWEGAWEAIKSTVTQILTNISDTITNIFEQIKTTITNVTNALKEYLSDTWESIKSALVTIITNIFNAIKTKFEEMQKTIQSSTDAAKDFLRDAWDEVFSFVKQIVGNIFLAVKTKFEELVSSVSSKMSEVKTTISDIWQEVMAFFSGIDLFSIGSNIISGLLSGITSMASSLYAKASEIAGKISSTISGALGIKSPSRVMMGFGKNIGEGLVIGMDDTVSKVSQASENLSDAVSGAFSSLSSSSAKSQSFGNSSTSSTSIDNSKSFAPVVNVYTTESPTKIMQRELRRMAFQF